MVVAFYINTIERGGGAERAITGLANYFARKKDRAVMITSFRVKEEYPLDGFVERYSIEDKEIIQSALKRNISRIKGLRRILKEIKPDVLVSFMSEACVRALPAAFGLPVKTVLSVRNDPSSEYAGTMRRLFAKYIMPKADGCVFQTTGEKTFFPAKLQKKSVIIGNPVSEKFYGIKREPKEGLIINVGRLFPQKNQSLLIKAFIRVSKKYPDALLYIYGQGDLKKELQRQIDDADMADKIKLMGVSNNMPSVLSNADVFVLSSDFEGMPNALLEAMAAGVPCISTDCPAGGPKEIIRDSLRDFDDKRYKEGMQGLLVSPGDVNELCKALDRLLTDKALKESIGSNGAERAMDYREDVILKKWDEYIRSVAKI